MLKKSLVMFCSLVFAFTLLAASGPGAAGEKYVIKVAHTAAPENARQLGAMKIKEVLEADPNIDFEVQIYPTSQLGNDRDLIEGMQANNVEIVILPWSPLGGFQPLVTMMDLPFFLPRNKETLLKLYESPAIRDLWATTEEIGIKILGVWHTGYKHYTSNRPLEKLADFKGLKFRVQGSPILIKTIESLGGSPVTTPYAEAYTSLQTGALDAQGDATINSTYDMKMNEVQTDVTNAYYGALDMLIMGSKGWFDALPANVQQAIVNAVKAAAKPVDDESYRMEAVAIENMKKQGIRFHDLSPEIMAALRDAVKGVRDFYITEYGDRGKKLLDAVEKAMAELNK